MQKRTDSHLNSIYLSFIGKYFTSLILNNYFIRLEILSLKTIILFAYLFPFKLLFNTLEMHLPRCIIPFSLCVTPVITETSCSHSDR